jgi:TetR/AcrR family transcriptional regulator, regulator of cefoperazone and chloramphenicol sensitivity
MSVSKADRTREHLLLAGEELMAWRGIEAVSIRDINQKAAQKNTSAIRYHFANKRGLLEAILERRSTTLNKSRHECFDHLMSSKTPSDITLEDLIAAQFLPLAEVVLKFPEWQNYVLLLAQVMSVQAAAYEDLWRDKTDQTSLKIIDAMRTHVIEIDDALWRQRVRDAVTFYLRSLCERTFDMRNSDRAPSLTDDRYLAHLLSTIAVILSAPAPEPEPYLK